jgi:hypothetical protein
MIIDEFAFNHKVTEVRQNIRQVTDKPVSAEAGMMATQAQALILVAEMLFAIHKDLERLKEEK